MTSNELANIETGLAIYDLLGERRAKSPWCCGSSTGSSPIPSSQVWASATSARPSELSSPWFVGAALGLDMLNTFYVEHQPFMLGRLTVSETGGLVGKTMSRPVRAYPARGDHADAACTNHLEYPAHAAT